MKNCRDCGRVVSESSKSCPECGATNPAANHLSNFIVENIFLIFVVITLLIIYI